MVLIDALKHVTTLPNSMLSVLASVLGLTGCVHSLEATSAAVMSPSGRSAWLGGVGVRDELRLPRTYQVYLGTEAILAHQFATGDAPPDAGSAGQAEPAESFGLRGGWQRIPEASERYGWRIGPRLGVWHGALGDSSARWAVHAGMDFAPVIRLFHRPQPWQADELVSVNFLFMPTLFVDPLVVRLGRSEQSHYAFSYGVMLSFAASLSSTLVP